jgi:hypothetical protein
MKISRILSILLIGVITICAVETVPRTSHAGTIDTLAQILDVVHSFDSTVPTGQDLKTSMQLIDCFSKGQDEAVVCVANYGGALTGNPYLSTIAELYVAVNNNDFWGVVGVVSNIVGDEAPCIIADIMMPGVGGSLCELFKELLALAGQVLGAIAEFFSSIGGAIWDGMKAAYCGVFGCDSDSPPPPAPEKVAYDGFFKPYLDAGVQCWKNDKPIDDPVMLCLKENYGKYTWQHLLQCLSNYATSHNQPDNAVWIASQLYQKQVEANWTTEVVKTDIPAYGKRRLTYEQNLEMTLQAVVLDMAARAKTDYQSVSSMSPSTYLMNDCMDKFSSFKHIDKWILAHPSEAATLNVAPVKQYCTNIANGDKYKKLFAELIGSYMGYKICPYAANKYRCESAEDYLSCLGLEGSIGQKGRCAITPAATQKAADKITAYFKSQGSKIACSTVSDGLRFSEKPIDFVCPRPTQYYWCDKKNQEYFSKIPLKLVNCVVREPADYTALKGQVNTALNYLTQRYSNVTFSRSAVDPLAIGISQNILSDLANDPKQNYGFGPPSTKNGFDYKSWYKETIDGESTPVIVYDTGSRIQGALLNQPKENIRDALKDTLKDPGHVDPIDQRSLNKEALKNVGLAGSKSVAPSAQKIVAGASVEKLQGAALAGAETQTKVMSGQMPADTSGTGSKLRTSALGSVTPSSVVATAQQAAQAASPDIIADRTVTIGSRSFPWDAPVTLDASAAVRKSGGACIFPVQYVIKNIGAAATGAFGSSWSNSITGPLPERQWSPLSPGASANQTEMVSLRPGQNLLTLTIDQKNQVKESNENNNQYRLPVNVTGNCSELIKRALPLGR